MKIGLMTTQQFAVNTFNHLRRNFNTFELITIKPEEAKKNNVSGYFNYESICKKNNISYNFISSYGFQNDDDVKKIRNLKLDILCVFGWNRLIPKVVLDSLSIGSIGSHSSPGILPFGRGRSPVVWGIKLGFSQIYNQLFKLSEGIDDGDILAINRINIDNSDTIDYIYQKIAFSQVMLIDIAIDNLINNKRLIFNNDNIDLFLPKRNHENAFINWNMSAFDIHNLIRAVYPTYHGAFFNFKNKKFEAYKAKVWDINIQKEYRIGEIISVIDKTLIIKCGIGYLALLDHNLPISEDILSGGSILESL